MFVCQSRFRFEQKLNTLIIIFQHWQISLGRRFRSLKIWFLLRIYGSEGIEQYIRRTIQMAEMFENYVKSDSRFELATQRSMSLVCFRLKVCTKQRRNLYHRLIFLQLLGNLDDTLFSILSVHNSIFKEPGHVQIEMFSLKVNNLNM